MADVERFGWVLGADGENGGIDRRDDGGFVRYSDYEKLRNERDSLRSQVEAEVKRMRSEAGDWHLNAFIQQQAGVDANRLQAILDSSNSAQSGRGADCMTGPPPKASEGSADLGEGRG